MASKADMLKKSVRKTGTGLFAGMQSIKEEEVKEEKTKAVEKAEKPIEEPIIEVKEEKKIEQVVNQPVKKPAQAVNQTQAPVNEYVAPQVQPVYQQPIPQPVQPVVQQVVPMQPEPQIQQVQPQSVYIQQPVQTAQPVQPVQDVEQPVRKAAKAEKNSRYEKDKFLLLDIRGLRDYVEHMAKAANMSATKYIRNLIEIDMQQNMDIYEAHKALEERLKERR